MNLALPRHERVDHFRTHFNHLMTGLLIIFADFSAILDNLILSGLNAVKLTSFLVKFSLLICLDNFTANFVLYVLLYLLSGYLIPLCEPPLFIAIMIRIGRLCDGHTSTVLPCVIFRVCAIEFTNPVFTFTDSFTIIAKLT